MKFRVLVGIFSGILLIFFRKNLLARKNYEKVKTFFCKEIKFEKLYAFNRDEVELISIKIDVMQL